MDDRRDSAGAPSRAELVFPSGVEALAAPASFIEMAEGYGLAFEDGEIERLGRYLALLLAANELVNLTAIREADDAWERHIFDALTLLPVLAEVGDGARVIDVGSGGGLPGIPLAIVLPGVRFVLLEPTGKKAAFLSHAVKELGLTNVEVLRERAEAIAASGGPVTSLHRNGYDAVVARAVGRLATLAEITVPLAKIGGLAVLVKGQRADEELDEAKAALHALCVSHAGTVKTPTGRIVVLEKRRPTPAKYPRSAAEIKRSALG